MCADRARVFSIPAGVPFLPAFADALLAGRIVPGWPDPQDPLSLADGLILLPTRRAARALTALLAERASAEGRAVLLPRIVPLGDVDEAEEAGLLERAGDGGGFGDASHLPPEMNEATRRIVLARLILAWARSVDRAMLKLDEGEALLVPAGPADALALAGDLGRLIDTLSIHGKTFEDLHRLVPDDFSRYWAISRDFLAIAARAWPDFCAERGGMDAALRRHRMLLAEAARLERLKPPAPIVAAGSTGSMPATAALLHAISRLPRGAVVLPGLDMHLEERAWRAVSGEGEGPEHPGHPQSILAKLLPGFGLARDGVEQLGRAPAALAAREVFLSEALRPAETTDAWSSRRDRLSDDALRSALDGIGVIEAADDREEALAIAVALRGALEEPEATAALVTPDRALAERVSAELRRWSVEVDDSAGQPLARSAPGVIARLAAEAAASDFEPNGLLALLAHPLCRLGLPRRLVLRGRAALEIGLLRGPALPPGLASLRRALPHAKAAAKDDRRTPGPRRRLFDEDWSAADRVLEALEMAFAGFRPEALPRRFDLLQAVALHEAVLTAVTEHAPGEDAPPAAGDAEEVLAGLFDDVRETQDQSVEGVFGDYPGFFAGLMAGRVTRRQSATHRRLRIWGPLEARLLHADLMILGGLDEKTWPPETNGDAFLNRPLREQLGLPALERRIGQTAHDFAQALGAPRAILTRALKRGGDPTVPSRLLQRMQAVVGPAPWREVLARGAETLRLARLLDRPDQVQPIRRPAPRPAAALQPARLSVTEIETLVRDPYSIYAKHVLRLDPLDDIAVPPTAASRGTLVHEVLGLFAERYPDALPTDLRSELIAVGREVFGKAVDLQDRPDIRAFWWPRFLRVAGFLADWELGRRALGPVIHPEVGGKLLFALADGTEFALTGRADRIEQRPSGGLAIVDFKTGAMPGVKEVQVGFSPQLTLEAAMAQAGAFENIPGGCVIDELLYVHLTGGAKSGAVRNIPPGEAVGTIEELGALHLARLKTMLDELRSGERSFLSRPHPKYARRYAPYDHLARVREWSLLGSDVEGGEP